MRTILQKLLLSLFILCCLQSTHAQTCPNPLPSNAPPVAGYPAIPSPPPISPNTLLNGQSPTYWLIGDSYKSLSSYTVTVTGNNILVTAYIPLIGVFPLSPARCFPVPLPALEAGIYYLTLKKYTTYTNPPVYPLTPTTLEAGPFEVKEPEKVPLSQWLAISLSVLILSIVIARVKTKKCAQQIGLL
jgi:hypothetical protein